jgi:hypothetical protein
MMAKIGKSPMVLVVESFNRKTGLGSRFGSQLLERGYKPNYNHLGTHIEDRYLDVGIAPTSRYRSCWDYGGG